MKQTLLAVLIFLFCCCSSRTEKVNGLDSETKIDTSLIEKQLDSIFWNTHLNNSYSYVMKVRNLQIEYSSYEKWFLDSSLNIIRYENEWSGEGGAIGKQIQEFKNSEFVFESDTVNELNTESISLLHSKMKEIKGIYKYITYKDENFNRLYYKKKTTLNSDNIISVKRKLLYQDKVKTIEKSQLSILNSLKTRIKEIKDSVVFEKGIARIALKDKDESTEYIIDSLLFNRIIIE